MDYDYLTRQARSTTTISRCNESRFYHGSGAGAESSFFSGAGARIKRISSGSSRKFKLRSPGCEGKKSGGGIGTLTPWGFFPFFFFVIELEPEFQIEPGVKAGARDFFVQLRSPGT